MDYKSWLDSSPYEFKKKLIESFLKNTVEYANSHIKQRQKELTKAAPEILEEKCSRLYKWLGYIEFQEHTLNELKGSKIDKMIP